MEAKYPLVSIVILNWNGLEDTKECLKYARQLDYPNFEIVLVDNGSKKHEKDYLSKEKDIIYVDNAENRGFAGGQVDGLNNSNGEFILLLNNDAVIKSDYIKQAMPIFEDRKIAVVGGRAYFWNDTEPIFNEDNNFYSYLEVNPLNGETAMLRSDGGLLQEVNTVSGCAVIVRRSAVDEIGYLNEAFFAYYEETDLFARMKRGGFKVMYSPLLRVWHQNGASSGAQTGSPFFFYHIFRNRYIFAIRNFERPYLTKFMRSYFRSGLLAIRSISEGENQRVVGQAYKKAMLENLLNTYNLLRERSALRKQFGGINYCEKIFEEQSKISIVIDCESIDKATFHNVIASISQDQNKRNEYLLLTSKSDNYDSKLPVNAHVVLNNDLLSINSINLACLSSSLEWMLICSANNLPKIEDYLDLLPKLRTTKTKVVSLETNLEPTALVIQRDYFQNISGYCPKTKNLSEYLGGLLRYAAFDNRSYTNLISRSSIVSSSTRDQELSAHKLVKLNAYLDKTSRLNYADRLYSRHRYLNQLRKLTRWYFSPQISYKSKLAKTSKIFTSIIRMKRSELASEIRDMQTSIVIREKPFVPTKIMEKSIISLGQELQLQKKDTPIFILESPITTNTEKMITWFATKGYRKIIILGGDLNKSSRFKGQYLKMKGLNEDSPWSEGFIRVLVPEGYYFLTSSDILPADNCPSDACEYLLEKTIKLSKYIKVGLGSNAKSTAKIQPMDTDNLIESPLGVTLAAYKPYTYRYMVSPSIITESPYVLK